MNAFFFSFFSLRIRRIFFSLSLLVWKSFGNDIIARHSTTQHSITYDVHQKRNNNNNKKKFIQRCRVCASEFIFVWFRSPIYYVFLWISISLSYLLFCSSKNKKKRDKETRVRARAFLLALTKVDRETLLRWWLLSLRISNHLFPQ